MDTFDQAADEIRQTAAALGVNNRGIRRLLDVTLDHGATSRIYVHDDENNTDKQVDVNWWRTGVGSDRWDGGTRYHHGATRQDAIVKARTMWWKRALVEPVSGEFTQLVRGGAKTLARIFADGDALPIHARLQLGVDMGRQLAGVIGGSRGTVAPDVNTTYTDMEAIARGARLAGNDYPDTVAGRLVTRTKGTDARVPATSWGVIDAIDACGMEYGLDLSSCSAALEGFGNVGGHVYAGLEHRLQFQLVSDAEHAIRLDPAADELHTWALGGRKLADFPAKTAATHEEVRLAPVDFLILAGVGGIDDETARKTQARFIIAPANNAIPARVARVLHERGVIVLPELIVSSYGTMVSDLETRYGPFLPVPVARQLVRRSGIPTVQRVLREAVGEFTPGEAGLRIAIRRIAETGQLGRQRHLR